MIGQRLLRRIARGLRWRDGDGDIRAHRDDHGLGHRAHGRAGDHGPVHPHIGAGAGLDGHARCTGVQPRAQLRLLGLEFLELLQCGIIHALGLERRVIRGATVAKAFELRQAPRDGLPLRQLHGEAGEAGKVAFFHVESGGLGIACLFALRHRLERSCHRGHVDIEWAQLLRELGEARALRIDGCGAALQLVQLFLLCFGQRVGLSLVGGQALQFLTCLFGLGKLAAAVVEVGLHRLHRCRIACRALLGAEPGELVELRVEC